MEVDGFRLAAPSVLETDRDPVTVDGGQIAELIATARGQPNGRARLLLHPDRQDSLHEMVIALPASSFDRPHINEMSGKSFTALSGQFAVMCFSDDGAEATPVVLSAGDWPGVRIARLRKPTWHTVIPLQGDTVFLETIVGPFAGNRFAAWFPQADDEGRQAAEDRLRRLARSAAERMGRGA